MTRGKIIIILIISITSLAVVSVGVSLYSSSMPIDDAPAPTSQPVEPDTETPAPAPTSQPVEPDTETPAPVPTSQPVEPDTETPALVDELQPAENTYLNTKVTHDVTMRHNTFAIDMYQQIAKEPDQQDKNIFFSPFSMHVAFSSAYEGARGETASQMEDVFGFYSDEDLRHEYVLQTMSSLNPDDPHTILETANSLWSSKEYKLYDEYVNTVRTVYSADVGALDFANDAENSAARINEWVKDNTHDKINKIIDKKDITLDLIAVLINAVYFKGMWINQFDPNSTLKETFWLDDGSTIKTDLMHLQSVFGHAEVDNIQVLEMSYEGERLSMLVFLPLDRHGLSQLEGLMSAEKMYGWWQHVQPTEVKVTLPKFTAETRYNLVDMLSNMGMPLAFDTEGADFSGMADIQTLPGNLYVGRSTHAAFVQVNEEGTEAAAVTAIDMLADSEPPPVLHFNANHPFIFAITDNESGLILFMGRFMAPMT